MSDYIPEHRAGDDPLIGDAPPNDKTLFSNSVYDKLKFLAVIVLPALGALYFGLASIWGLPKAEEVVGTLVVVDTFLGVVLQLSNKQYLESDARFDGEIDVRNGGVNEEGIETTDVNVSLDSAAVADKDEIVVKVNRV